MKQPFVFNVITKGNKRYKVLISRFLYLLDYILNTLSRHYNIIYDLTLPKTILHAYINTTA